MKELRLGDRTLAYDDTGAGAPLVLLHAFPFDRGFFGGVTPALAERRRVLAPDFPGFGGSSPVAAPTLAGFADDVAALLDALGLAKAAVLGLSMGGYVALAFAARHPARLERLVLCDTKAAADTPEARKARDESIAFVQKAGAAAFAEKQLPRLVSPSCPETVRGEIRALMERASPTAIAAALGALRDRPDRTAELDAIACPTLVVVGADDALTPPAEARAMQNRLPQSHLVELAGVGHLPNLENPREFAAAVAPFVAA